MANDPRPPQALPELIAGSFAVADAHRRRLATLSVRAAITSLVLGALATFLAGLAGLAGRPVIAGDWRLTCAVASLLTLGATVVGGLQAILWPTERQVRASACVGKLRALLVAAAAPAPDWDALRREYQQVLTDHADVEA